MEALENTSAETAITNAGGFGKPYAEVRGDNALLWVMCCGEGAGDSASKRRSSQGQGQGYSAAASSDQASFSAE